MLLAQESVQKELKLTPDQITKVGDAAKKQQEARLALPRDLAPEERRKKSEELNKETEKSVADILKPDQAKRLKQITLQQAGAAAFAREDVAKELNISAEQKQKLNDIQAAARKERQDLFQGGGGLNEESRKKMAEITKNTNEKAMSVLTAEQKTKWNEMTGEPFKGEIRFGPPGGGNRRPGGRPDRN
jgi:Spy/CpxP family protein refolding chaperone